MTFFIHFLKFTALPFLNFGIDPKFDQPMCILLKLHYAKFGFSNLFFSKVIEENLWGVGSTQLGKGRVKTNCKGYSYPFPFDTVL